MLILMIISVFNDKNIDNSVIMEELVIIIIIITIITVIKLIYRRNSMEGKKKSKQTNKLDLIKKLVR